MGWRKEMVDGLGRDAMPTERWYEMVYDVSAPSCIYVRWLRDGELVPIERRSYRKRRPGPDRRVRHGAAARAAVRHLPRGSARRGQPGVMGLLADGLVEPPADPA